MSAIVHGALAQFEGPEKILHAAAKVREAGFSDWDVHSPYPLHGMDDAMGEKRSPLGWIVGGMAIAGFVLGLWLQWWASSVAYPLIVSGKLYFSYQAYFPITFSLTVLFSVFGTVFGMFGMIQQSYHHPVFYSENFAKATDDGFFVSILASDPKFDADKTREFLKSIGGEQIELLEEEA